MTDYMRHVMEARGTVLFIILEGNFRNDAPDYFKNLETSEQLLQPWNFRKFDHVVFDFSKVHTMSSSGIGLLVLLRNMAKRYGITRNIAIFGANEHVMHMLTASQLTLLFDIFETAEQAMEVKA